MFESSIYYSGLIYCYLASPPCIQRPDQPKNPRGSCHCIIILKTETGGTITEHGKKEAAALGTYLAKHNITHVASSPMGRALDTARLATEHLPHLNIQIEPWAQELSKWRRRSNGEKKPPAVWDTPASTIREELQDAYHGECNDCKGWTHVCLDHAPHKEKYREFCSLADEFLARHGIFRENHTYKMTPASSENRSELRIAVFMHHP